MNTGNHIASACMNYMNKIHRSMQFYEKCRTSFDDLTFLQLQVLLFIMERQIVSMKELAVQFKVRPASMTPLVDRLIAKQMLVRKQDSKDRRVMNVTLSEVAQSSLIAVFHEKTKGMEFVLSFLTSDEQKSLLHIMEKIDKGLSEHFES